MNELTTSRTLRNAHLLEIRNAAVGLFPSQKLQACISRIAERYCNRAARHQLQKDTHVTIPITN